MSTRSSQRVVETLERTTLWAAQTPQFAMASELRAAHEEARNGGIAATDDAALLERMGIEVVAVATAAENFKVTIPPDVDASGEHPFAASAPARGELMRVGHGFDAHRLVEGRPLILGRRDDSV